MVFRREGRRQRLPYQHDQRIFGFRQHLKKSGRIDAHRLHLAFGGAQFQFGGRARFELLFDQIVGGLDRFQRLIGNRLGFA